MLQQSRRGFTLIELMIVVVVIGVLASIAIPKFESSKERAYVVAMRNDLRNLIAVQLVYHSNQDPQVYADQVADFGSDFRLSAGVDISIADATGRSWSAIATHAASSTRCAVFIGTPPVAPATVDGEIACD